METAKRYCFNRWFNNKQMEETTMARLRLHLRTSVLFGILLASLPTHASTWNPNPPQAQILACSDCTQVIYSYMGSSGASGYSTPADACRAAEMSLAMDMANSAGVGCEPCPSDPTSCFEQILCASGTCTELSVGPAFKKVGSSTWSCVATYMGMYGVCCAECDG